jgi:hypothetical protein
MKYNVWFSSVTEFSSLKRNMGEIYRKEIGTNSSLYTNIHPQGYRISNYNTLG